MRLAINTLPLVTGHKVRGIGSYTQKLISHLEKIPDLKVVKFEDPKDPPDADIIHYPYFDFFQKTLPSKSKIPRVVTIHDVIPLVFPNYFPAGIHGYLNLFFQKRALKNVDAVIADSKASKSDIADKLSYPKPKTHVVYLAPGDSFKKVEDKKKLAKVATKFNLPEKFVLSVGDVNWNKNLLNLIRAAKIAKADLVMVGQALLDKDLPQVIEIDNLIKSLNFAPKIHRLGFVDEAELLAIYNLAKVTLQPSYYEGFGLPVLESMACGTPVICSNNSSLAEIAGEASIYCDPESPDDIAAKIREVLNLDISQRNQLISKSMANAAKYTWDKTAKQTYEVYKSLL